MSRDLFVELVGTPPPSTVDVDRVVRTQRRRRSVKRGALAGGCAVLVALALGPLLLWPGGGLPFQFSAPSPIPTPANSVFPSLGGIEPTEPPEAAKLRLQAAMVAAVLAEVPTAILTADRSLPPSEQPFLPQHAEHIPSPGSNSAPAFTYQGRALVEVNGITTVLYFRLERRPWTRIGCGPDHQNCATWTAPDGSQVTEFTDHDTYQQGDGTFQTPPQPVEERQGVFHFVQVIRPNGEMLTINHGTGGPADGPVPETALTPLELVHIALNPLITIYP